MDGSINMTSYKCTTFAPIMPSLVATMSALAQKPCVSTHYVRTKIVDHEKKGSHLSFDFINYVGEL